MSPDQRRLPRRLKPSSRPLRGPAVVPDGGPLRELKRLLFQLYQDCGSPSYQSIAGVMEGRLGALAETGISQYLMESTLPPNQQSTMTLAAALASFGPHDPDDVRHQVRRLWVAAKNWAPPGTLISKLDDPLLLEVHEAITVAGSQTLPVLPPYLERPHDIELRARLAAAAECGRSTMVVLVGGSSTGKTRACWEAIHADADGTEILDGWRLWHPFDPTRPEAILDGLQGIGPRTVVWLNEAQHYLLTGGSDLGERVAARLRTLLSDLDRAPVVVLGTLWPTYWHTLTHNPAQPDPHAQARQLLERTEIVVPPSFDPAAVTALLEATDTDPRLLEAASRAKNGELTQYLAGAPALLKHYETAPTAEAKALLTLAMDLRRLGHGPALPEDLLEAGTPAYLTELEWDGLDDDWFGPALQYAQQRCHGAHRPLTRIRPRPGQPEQDRPHYRLADYLEQLGQQRRSQIIPPALWATLVTNISDPDDAGRIGRAAADRLLHRYAVPLLNHAANAGNNYAAHRLARLPAERGDEAELRALAGPALRPPPGLGESAIYTRNNFTAVDELAELLGERGDEAGLRALLADTDNSYAVDELAELLGERGDEAGLRALLADTGNNYAAHRLAELLGERGDEAGLRALLADTGNRPAAGRGFAALLAERGDEAGLRALLADTDNNYAARRLAELLGERGDEAGLRALLADTENWHAAIWYAAIELALLLGRQGDEAGLRTFAETWNAEAGWGFAALLAERGDEAGLRALLADTGNRYAEWRLAELLAGRGDETGLRLLILLGHSFASRQILFDLLVERDRAKAGSLSRYGLNADGTIADA